MRSHVVDVGGDQAAFAAPAAAPAEVPFFIFMVVLNLIIIAAILDAAAVLPFLPERLQDSGWATAIRAGLISLLLLVPA